MFVEVILLRYNLTFLQHFYGLGAGLSKSLWGEKKLIFRKKIDKNTFVTIFVTGVTEMVTLAIRGCRTGRGRDLPPAR